MLLSSIARVRWYDGLGLVKDDDDGRRDESTGGCLLLWEKSFVMLSCQRYTRKEVAFQNLVFVDVRAFLKQRIMHSVTNLHAFGRLWKERTFVL